MFAGEIPIFAGEIPIFVGEIQKMLEFLTLLWFLDICRHFSPEPQADCKMVDLQSRNSETFGLAADVRNSPKKCNTAVHCTPTSPRISVTSINFNHPCIWV